MILCVTPNPAIDRTVYLEGFHLGEVHRAQKILIAAGGKGLNVARAIRTLGGYPYCIGLIGGHTGNLLAELAKQEGLQANWTQIKNETRTCIILVQPDQDATVINETGASVDIKECKEFVEEVWKQAASASIICVSGSLPLGFQLGMFASMLAGLVEMRKPVWVDASDSVLRTALNIPGINIKVNTRELGDVLGMDLINEKLTLKAIRQLREMGIEQASITFGKDGAILGNRMGIWKARIPELEIISSVGSGDVFLGGLAFALEAGVHSEFALCQAVAAGAANALLFGGGKFSLDDYKMIHQKTKSSLISD
jgi:tagatose 6-phosphate kinase